MMVKIDGPNCVAWSVRITDHLQSLLICHRTSCNVTISDAHITILVPEMIYRAAILGGGTGILEKPQMRCFFGAPKLPVTQIMIKMQ